MTPRQTVSNILKKIEVKFPLIENKADYPEFVIRTNGVLEELTERIALAEKDLTLPAALNRSRSEFIVKETDSILKTTKKNTDELYNEEYCKARGQELFCWMLKSVPHGIFREFADQLYKHWTTIKEDQDVKCETG